MVKEFMISGYSQVINKMPRDRRDFFYKKAKQEGYRSRAAFKLKQINEKFKIIKKGDAVVDLGAAPGGWLQVAKELSGGTVIGGDLLDKVRRYFGKVKAFSPEASRKQSAEIYVIGKELLTGAVKMKGEYTVTIEDIGASGDGIAKINDFV